MTKQYRLIVLDESHRAVFDRDLAGSVEIGRQDRGELGPYDFRFADGGWRLVIAAMLEDTIPRRYATVELLPTGRLRVRNGGKTLPIRTLAGAEIHPGETREVGFPAQWMVGRKTIRVEPLELTEEQGLGLIQELPVATLPPGSQFSRKADVLRETPLASPDAATIVRALQVAMDVLQAAASSTDFFVKAAQATLELVGLDSASVLELRDGQWNVVAYQTGQANAVAQETSPNRHVLRLVRERRKTIWEVPTTDATATASLNSLAAVVAAPILDREGTVIGALYGDRSYVGSLIRSRGEITEIQAMLVELLASGIAAGLERLKQEKAAVAARVQFEQFFTPDLARHLARNPDLLAGRESEVTLLFCDIRGFSRISARVGSSLTVAWINDVMAALSDAVAAHQGVLVDYIGDELLAMWNAPQEQPDHAVLACRAALDMSDQLAMLNERWAERLGGTFDLGIGINTGMAQVGNTGSPRKFKYGPLGNTVNLASRVQGATKHFHTRMIITGQTRAQTGDSFITRRLGRVRVVNIAEPVELFELSGTNPGHLPEPVRAAHEEALTHFEERDLRSSARILSAIQADNPTDGPSLILLGRVVAALCDGGDYDPVWNLHEK